MQKTEFDMSRNHRAALAGVIAATALAATACSNEAQEPEVSEPSFSAVETTSSQATTSAETTSSEAATSETSSAETSSEGSTTSAKQEGNGSFNDSLDNGDGTYRLTNEPPGGGTARDVMAVYRDMPAQGLSSIEVTAPAELMNGNMQYVLSSYGFDEEIKLKLKAIDLDERQLTSGDVCRIDMELLDEKGTPMPLEDANKRGECTSTFTWDPTFTGEFTMLAKIYLPGFEPLVIKQPIRIFD